MIDYATNGTIDAKELDCFFQNWKSPPSPDIKCKLLEDSKLIITARNNGKLVGFLTAISDGVMHAFITLLEVLEPYQGKGIGNHLMELAINHFKGYYDIVLLTDPDKREFYKKLGFSEIFGMHIRDFSYGKTEEKNE